jgi:hypothetical protein
MSVECALVLAIFACGLDGWAIDTHLECGMMLILMMSNISA